MAHVAVHLGVDAKVAARLGLRQGCHLRDHLPRTHDGTHPSADAGQPHTPARPAKLCVQRPPAAAWRCRRRRRAWFPCSRPHWHATSADPPNGLACRRLPPLAADPTQQAYEYLPLQRNVAPRPPSTLCRPRHAPPSRHKAHIARGRLPSSFFILFLFSCGPQSEIWRLTPCALRPATRSCWRDWAWSSSSPAQVRMLLPGTRGGPGPACRPELLQAHCCEGGAEHDAGIKALWRAGLADPQNDAVTPHPTLSRVMFALMAWAATTFGDMHAPSQSYARPGAYLNSEVEVLARWPRICMLLLTRSWPRTCSQRRGESQDPAAVRDSGRLAHFVTVDAWAILTGALDAGPSPGLCLAYFGCDSDLDRRLAVVTVTAILATVWSKSSQTVYQARGRIWSVGVDLCAGSLAFNPPPGATPGHSIIVAVRGAEVVGMACLAPPHKWTPADAAGVSCLAPPHTWTPADAAGEPAPSSRKLVGEELRLSIAPVREA